MNNLEDAVNFAELPSLQPLPTAAERAADLIREYIFEGKFLPGTALPETALAQALQVSRNTVREAFRTLINEHLLGYEMHKGVTVRWLTADDVRDIYRLRRMLELSAVDLVAAGTATLDLAALRKTLDTQERHGEAERWREAGTENARFHAQIVAAHGSPRTDEFHRRLMTELRLAFLADPDQQTLHGTFLSRKRALLDHVAAGRFDDLRSDLARYLDDAERRVLAAVEG